MLTVYKTLTTRKPSYIHSRLKPNSGANLRNGSNLNVHGEPTVTRGGFIYRGAKLFNMVPENIRSNPIAKSFKVQVKEWIKLNISIRPE